MEADWDSDRGTNSAIQPQAVCLRHRRKLVALESFEGSTPRGNKIHSHIGWLTSSSTSPQTDYWNPHSLGYKFFAEARRLWDIERLEPKSVTTVQAGMVIYIAYNIYSMDKIGFTYCLQGASIASEMGMFRPNEAETDSSLQTVREYAAWWLYFSVRFQCFHLMTPSPILDESAAALPDSDVDPGWYGEFLLQYPQNQTIIPMQYPMWTSSKYKLLSILRPVALELFDKEEKSDTVQSERLYLQAVFSLKNLFSTLPASLSATRIVFSLHMSLHLWYHNILLAICQLLVQQAGKNSTETHSTVAAQLLDSKICLETILRLCYLRNGYEAGSIMLLHFLSILSFIALGDIDPSAPPASQEDTRGTLILAAKGLYNQGRNFFMATTITHMVHSQMANRDRDILAHYYTASGENPVLQNTRARHVKSHYPLNIANTGKFRETQRLEKLIRQYEEMALQ